MPKDFLNANQALEMLQHDTERFLKKYSLTLTSTSFRPLDAAMPDVGRFVLNINIDDNRAPHRVIGCDGQRTAIRAAIQPEAVYPRPEGAEQPRPGTQVEMDAFHVPVQPAFKTDFSTVSLPRGEGPSLMFTTLVTACSVTAVPREDGGYGVAHVQPKSRRDILNGNTGLVREDPDRARNGHELHDALKSHARPGQLLLGKHDVEHTKANIVGVRNGQGQWKFYAQHLDLMNSHIVKVAELKPLVQARRGDTHGPTVPDTHISQSLQAVEMPDSLRVQPYADVSPLRAGEAVMGKVLAMDHNGKTCVRDDSKPGVDEALRPVRTFDTPPDAAERYGRGQEIHARLTEQDPPQLRVTMAPTELKSIHDTCEHLRETLTPLPHAPVRGRGGR